MNGATIAFTDAAHPQWNGGRVRSTAARERWALLAMAVFWNLMAQPLFWLVAVNEPDLEAWKLALIGLFPLVGVGLLYAAAVKWLQWRRFGALTLEMDPFPAAPGGDLGGTIEIPLRYALGFAVEVSLSCVQVQISQGKNKNRSERVLWRDRVQIEAEPGMRGSRVRFSFSIPEDQPATTPPSRDYIKWVVHLHAAMAGADLDQTFEVPVLADAEPRRSRRGPRNTARREQPAPLPANLVRLEHTVQGLRLYYPASRGRTMGLALTIFGAVFALVPWFIVHQSSAFAGDGFGMIFLVTGGLFGLVFGLVGLLLLLFGLHALFNSLEVLVSERGVISTRRLLGFGSSRRLERNAIQTLCYRINAQQGSGAKAKVHYVLEAVPEAGKAVCLGDGIRGRPLAGQVMAEIGQALGRTDWVESSRRRGRLRDRKV